MLLPLLELRGDMMIPEPVLIIEVVQWQDGVISLLHIVQIPVRLHVEIREDCICLFISLDISNCLLLLHGLHELAISFILILATGKTLHCCYNSLVFFIVISSVVIRALSLSLSLLLIFFISFGHLFTLTCCA